MPGRILIIRGGAIGDFILTLPAIGLLRDAFPDAWIEILGYGHIVEIARNRFYADATRSIEYGALAGFFHPSAPLAQDLCDYFAGFDQVVSYLFDPDGVFADNLRRAGVRNLICGPGKLNDSAHGARQLAAPLEQIALFLDSPAARIHPNESDFLAAKRLIPTNRPILAVHPGSGGERKNWPIERWAELIARGIETGWTVVGVGGEADGIRIEHLRSDTRLASVSWLTSRPLPELGAVFARVDGFVGHDSGISHLAAAAGCRCALMFGPTDPMIWSPANPSVKVIRADSGRMEDIELESMIGILDVWRRVDG